MATPRLIEKIKDEVSEYRRYVGTLPTIAGVETEDNTALVVMQLASASDVKTFPQWLKLGRVVKHGEKSLKIIAADGFLMQVFDISQTESLKDRVGF